ncbi:MAG: hypothetical protein ACREE2_07915 [Stellaceae bacterium]
MLATGLYVVAIAAARADTILWANDGRGSPGPTLDEWDLDVPAGSGTLINSFAAPDPAAQGGGPGGIAILGSTIYYGVANSGSIFLTNPSGANLGVAFSTGLPGISAITSDGTYLYLAATGNSTVTENVYQYTLSGTLVNTLTLVPTAISGPFTDGRAGLEIVGGNFVANQGNDEGPYNQFSSNGQLLTTEFLAPTDDFGFSGVAFDGTDYFAGNVEDVPSTFWVFDASGAFLKQLTLTGCPGPNQLCLFEDLAVERVSEPASLAMLAVFLAGFALLRRAGRPSHGSEQIELIPRLRR